jgi:VWFA-related protein
LKQIVQACLDAKRIRTSREQRLLGILTPIEHRIDYLRFHWSSGAVDLLGHRFFLKMRIHLSWFRRVTWGVVAALLTGSATAQKINPIQNNFDVMLRQGGILDIRTMEELDKKRNDQAETRSEATLSRLDLKAPGRARQQYAKGLQFLSRNEFSNAIDILLKATTAYPEFVSAHNALGCAYFGLKQNDLARQEFTRAIGLDDHLPNSYLNLGRVQMAMGETPAAQTSLEKASAIAPLDANLLTALAYVQFLNHDYPATIKSAQQAHNRKHPGTAVVHYFAAAAWQAQNNLPETQRELHTFLDEDPQSPFAEQARRTAELIQAKQDLPASPPATLGFEESPSGSAVSSRGQKVLQDFQEKQQIAEAEMEGSGIPGGSSPGPKTPATTDVPRGSGAGNNIALPQGGWVLRSSVDEVLLFFTATDHGRSVSNLTRNDVVIHDDRKPPSAILEFRTESELPLRLGLLIDTSVSITDRFTFEQVAASNFLQRVLTGKNDLAFVAGFSNSVLLVQDFTGDVSQASRELRQLVLVGGTAIWDAISFAADKLAENKEEKPTARVLVVISDGDDNSSSLTLKQAIEHAERDEVVVYTVSTRNAEPSADIEAPGDRAMKVLAELTGGAAFFPGSPDRLNHGLDELQQFLRSRYLVSYKPASFKRDGNYRAIAITAEKSGHKLKVNARKGYYTVAAQPAAANF